MDEITEADFYDYITAHQDYFTVEQATKIGADLGFAFDPERVP